MLTEPVSVNTISVEVKVLVFQHWGIVMARTTSDPCALIRRQVEQKQAEVSDLDIALGDPFDDLPPAVKKKLQLMRERAKARLVFLRRELSRCEAVP